MCSPKKFPAAKILLFNVWIVVLFKIFCPLISLFSTYFGEVYSEKITVEKSKTRSSLFYIELVKIRNSKMEESGPSPEWNTSNNTKQAVWEQNAAFCVSQHKGGMKWRIEVNGAIRLEIGLIEDNDGRVFL